MASVHRPTMSKKLVLLACCIALAASAAHAQDGSGSGIAGVTGLPPTLAPSPSKTTKAPTTKAPVTETPAPSPTTAEPTETPAPTTKKPVVTEAPTPTPEPETTTEAPTATPEPEVTTKAPKVKKASNVTEAPETAAPQTSLESAVSDNAAPASADSDASSTTTKSPSGASYGAKDSSSSGSNQEATTKDSTDSKSNVMTFAAVTVGVLVVVLVAALSVFTIQKRRAREAEEEEEDQKYVPSRRNSNKRPDLEAPITTTAAVPNYDNYSTPQHAVVNQYPDIRDEKAAAMGGQWKQPTVNTFRDSEDFGMPLSKPVAKNEWSGKYTAAAVGAGAGAAAGASTLEFNDDDVVEFSAYTQPMEPRITKFRGKSEDSNMDEDDFSQYSNHLMDSSSNNKLNMSASEVDLDSLHEAKPTAAAAAPSTTEFEFDQYFNAQPAASQENDVDVDDVDVDEEDEDIDVDIDDDNASRYSAASSVGEFHDSTVDRPSELDAEEFEV